MLEVKARSQTRPLDPRIRNRAVMNLTLHIDTAHYFSPTDWNRGACFCAKVLKQLFIESICAP
jgi:hypothetical protein